MCESVEIRYVHLMQHSDYPETLGVGCIYAENMENDKVNPGRREKKLKTKARRRKKWSNREWRTSIKGNPYLNTEGFNLTIFPATGSRGLYWMLLVTHRESGASQFGRRRYRSEEEAKKAALDALIWTKEHLGY